LTEHTKVNLLDFDRQGLEALFTAMGEKAFRASQVLKWIYQGGVDDFDDMTNLSKSLRESLKQRGDPYPGDRHSAAFR
jgi:23S rRNA (adenine2503-C2)-methyltransferase